MYRETIEVPLIISAPEKYASQLQKGTLSDELVELVDIYPTITDILEKPLQQDNFPLAGKSLLPILQGSNSGRHREFSFAENWSMSAVFDSRYTLGYWIDPLHPDKCDGAIVRDYRPDGNGELKGEHYLFDRENDPEEVINIFEKETTITQKMIQVLDDKRTSIPAIGKKYVLQQLENR